MDELDLFVEGHLGDDHVRALVGGEGGIHPRFGGNGGGLAAPLGKSWNGNEQQRGGEFRIHNCGIV